MQKGAVMSKDNCQIQEFCQLKFEANFYLQEEYRQQRETFNGILHIRTRDLNVVILVDTTNVSLPSRIITTLSFSMILCPAICSLQRGNNVGSRWFTDQLGSPIGLTARGP